MEIQWHGRTCVSIKGKSGTVLVDPYDPKKAGLQLPKIQVDFVLSNDDDENLSSAHFAKDIKRFDWPGEYESKGILVQNMLAFDRPLGKDEDGNKKDTDANPVMIYSLLVDGIRVCHLGNIGHKLTPELLEQIGDVDVLLVPVGGTLGVEKAHEVIEQIEPRLVIPINYEDPTKFLNEVGVKDIEAQKSVKIPARTALPTDKMDVNLLEKVVG